MFTDFIVIEIIKDSEDTCILRVKPRSVIPITPFQPGQYAKIKIPNYINPGEEHIFSIASSPNTKDYLEFYIRLYGEWTKTLFGFQIGDILQIAYPFGNFIFDNTKDRNAVFLVGGVGISPIMSMLRFINEEKYEGNYTLIYGNRTQETVAYQEELTNLKKKINHLKIIHIFSNLPPEDPWKGHRGFITKDILRKEVNFKSNPTFFIIGPPIFIEKMETILKELQIKRIKKELL